MRVPYVSAQGGGHPFAIFVISAQSAVWRERASATGSGSLHGGQSRFAGHRAERDHEGTTVGQADVREVQDHPPPWRRPRDLLRTRVTSSVRGSESDGTYRRDQHPAEQARRGRPDLHLRHRPLDRQPASGRGRHQPRHVRARPHRGRGLEASRPDRLRPDGRGRPAPRALAEHQAPDGDRLLPRAAPSSRPAGSRTEHEDQRSHAQGSQAHAGRGQEEGHARSKD